MPDFPTAAMYRAWQPFVFRSIPRVRLFCSLVIFFLATSSPAQHIRSILQDRKGIYWFGTDGEGLCRYDGKSTKWLTDKDGLCGNFVRKISEDVSGNLWIETRDGICSYDGKFFRRVIDRQTWSEPSVGGQFQYTPGSLWMGMGDGVFRYDGASTSYFTIDPAMHGVSRDLDRARTVYCTFEDKSGNIWFGTESGGVCRYDRKSFTWLTDFGLNKAAVRCIYQDRLGNLWFGNNGYGLFRYNGNSLTNITDEDSLQNHDYSKTLKSVSGTLARVWSIAEDLSGSLWVGTIDNGVWKIADSTRTNFTTNDGLPSNAIWTIYRDNAGMMWFGTDDAGVFRYDGKSFTKLPLSPAR